MSSTPFKLISHKLCPYVQRARIVLHEKSIPYEIEFIDLASKPNWFTAISPLGKVPVLLVDGVPLFESAAIVEYVDEISSGSLHPELPIARARNRAWIEFATNTLATISRFYNAINLEDFGQQLNLLKARFSSLEQELGNGPYFNGERFSLVDAAFAPVFRYFEVIECYRDFGFFDPTPKICGWRRALHHRPSVRDAVVANYAKRLHIFLLERNSVLSRIIRQERAA